MAITFAYVAGAVGDRRVFVRYLNSPTAKPLTRGARDWNPAGWSPDSKRVIVRGANPQGDKPPYALFAVPVFGGEPDLIMTLESFYVSVSPDGKALAAIGEPDNKLAVYTASPVGSPLQRYTPAPFESSQVSNSPNVQFSRDGRQIMLVEDITGGRQIWQLPYPAGTGAPQRVLTSLPNVGNTPRWSAFPDERTGILSLTTKGGIHLWFAGIRSGLHQPLFRQALPRRGKPAGALARWQETPIRSGRNRIHYRVRFAGGRDRHAADLNHRHGDGYARVGAASGQAGLRHGAGRVFRDLDAQRRRGPPTRHSRRIPGGHHR